MTCICIDTITHHKAKVTHFHLLFHFGQDVRVHGLSKKHHVGSQQTVAIALATPSQQQEEEHTRIDFNLSLKNKKSD